MLTCEFCQKEYSSKSSLNHHVKTNKKCILLRGETLESKLVFNCPYCEFKTFTKFGLKSHLCKNKTELEKKHNFDVLVEENKENERKLKVLEKHIQIQHKKAEIEKDKLRNENLLLLNTELNKAREEYIIKLKEATDNFEKERSKLEEKIKTHESHLFSLSAKPTNTTTSNVRIQNNIYNNLETLDLNEDKIRREVEDNFTDNHFNEGKR